MSDDLSKLVDKAEYVLARNETYREKIEELRYVLTGPVGSRVIRESAAKKRPSKSDRVAPEIHDALVLLHDRERPPYPADHIIIEKMGRIFGH